MLLTLILLSMNMTAFSAQRAQCLLTDAPSLVDEKQLKELHIRLRNPIEAAKVA